MLEHLPQEGSGPLIVEAEECVHVCVLWHVCVSGWAYCWSMYCFVAKSETREAEIKGKEGSEKMETCAHAGAQRNVTVSVFVCVSEMDSLWPGRINSLPDWLRLSGNVTGEPEQDLIAIRVQRRSSRGQRAQICNPSNKHPSLQTLNRSTARFGLRAINLSESV